MSSGAEAPQLFQVRQLNHPAEAGFTALLTPGTQVPDAPFRLANGRAKPFDCRYLAERS